MVICAAPHTMKAQNHMNIRPRLTSLTEEAITGSLRPIGTRRY